MSRKARRKERGTGSYKLPEVSVSKWPKSCSSLPVVPYYWEALDRNAGEWKCWHVRVCVFTFSLLTYPARKSSFIRNRFLGAERSLYATHTVVSAYDRYICTLCNCETEELCSLGCYLPSIKLQLRARQGASHRSTIVISRKSFSFTLFSLACFFYLLHTNTTKAIPSG